MEVSLDQVILKGVALEYNTLYSASMLIWLGYVMSLNGLLFVNPVRLSRNEAQNWGMDMRPWAMVLVDPSIGMITSLPFSMRNLGARELAEILADAVFCRLLAFGSWWVQQRACAQNTFWINIFHQTWVEAGCILINLGSTSIQMPACGLVAIRSG